MSAAHTSTPAAPAQRVGTFQPNVDIFETPEAWKIVADVPGASREGLDVDVEDGVLGVRARVSSRPGPKTEFILREYPVGDFERSFHLGDGVDAAGITASLDKGVLTIHLPKAESTRPRKISIQNT